MNYLIYIDENSILKEIELTYNKKVIDGLFHEVWECTPPENYIIVGVVLNGKLVDFNYPENYNFNLTATEMFLSKPNNANYVILDRYFRTANEPYQIENIFASQSNQLGNYPILNISATQLSVGLFMIAFDFKKYDSIVLGYQIIQGDNAYFENETVLKSVMANTLPAQEIINSEYYKYIKVKVLYKGTFSSVSSSISAMESNSVTLDETTPSETTPLLAINVLSIDNHGGGLAEVTISALESNFPTFVPEEYPAYDVDLSLDGETWVNYGQTDPFTTLPISFNSNIYKYIRVHALNHDGFSVYSNYLEIIL